MTTERQDDQAFIERDRAENMARARGDAATETGKLPAIIAFLLGETELDGAWFGEKPDGERGQYWWRKQLHAYALEALARDRAAQGEEIDRLRSVIERDRTVFCVLIRRTKETVRSRRHLTDENARAASGYTYDEPGLIREFAAAYEDIWGALEQAHRTFRDFADCPRGQEAVSAAQAEATKILDARPPMAGDAKQWQFENAMWRMFQHGVDRNSVSAQCEVQMLPRALAGEDIPAWFHPSVTTPPAGDAQARVDEAMVKYATVRDSVGGCTDGWCFIKRPTGMHTNGGCRCWKDSLKAQRMMRAGQELFAALQEKQ